MRRDAKRDETASKRPRAPQEAAAADRLRAQSRKIPLKKIPDGLALHPLVYFIDGQLEARGLNPIDLERVSGVSAFKICRWRRGLAVPLLPDIEAAINALGFYLPPPASIDDAKAGRK